MSLDPPGGGCRPTAGIAAPPAPRPGCTPGLDRVAALARRLPPLVAAGPGAATITARAPFTGVALAEVPVSTPADVDRVVRRAREAQPVWAARQAEDRAAVLLRVHDLVLQRQSEAMDLVQAEAGKARLHAYEEVVDVAIAARFSARRGPGIIADRRHPGLVPGLTRVTEVHHPRGVVGIVAPWNYPLALVASDALPALLAGNAVVLRPDPLTTLTAAWVVEVLVEAGVPEELVALVTGDGPVTGAALVDAADYVCFTGSTATGRRVAEQAARRLVGTSLELGGKNSLYVAEDADLDRAAEAAVRDCFTSAGQLCVAAERLVLHERVADEFLRRFLDRVGRLRMGVALDFSVDLGCLVSSAHLDRVSRHVTDAVERGAVVLAGGRARPDLGPLFFEPTVLDRVPATAACHHEETFGPVVTVHRVSSDAEAVAIANDTEYGLTATVWTRDRRRGEVLARRLRCGTVNINESYIAAWGSAAAPMGGRKASGLGRRHGVEGLLRFTESQTIAVQRGPGLGWLYGQGGRRMSAALSTALRATRRTHLPWP